MRTVSASLCKKLRELHHRSLGILCISKSTSCCSDINQWRNCQIIHKYCTEIHNMEKCNVIPMEGKDMENGSKTIENCGDGFHVSDHVPDEMTLKKNDPEDSQGQGDCNLHRGKVFVGNISFRVRRHRLWGFFEKFGKVDSMYLARDNARKGGAHKGYGFVTFKREQDATKVLNAADEELVLDNRQLRVAPVERKQLPKVSLPMRLVTASVSEAEKSELSTAADKSDDKLARHKLQHDVDVGKAGAMSRDNTPEVVTSAAALENLNLEEESAPGNGLIMILNADILLNIFSYLSIKDRIIIERVCKRWRLVVLRSWQSLESLSFENLFGGFTHLGALTDYIFSSVLKRGCQELRSLDLSASPHFLTDWSINKIGKRCRNLLQLNLSGVKINNFDLRTLASQCTKLQVVKLSRCFDVGEKGVWWLFKHCTCLKTYE
ncbi:putative RNA-binding protein EEED8.10 [Ptychodera flava]|uniref:putative RNA-binding protein EEED8.10 n=1 Tax=Ptychodera flava TaxID=63121 RepID=UPI003969EF71